MERSLHRQSMALASVTVHFICLTLISVFPLISAFHFDDDGFLTNNSRFDQPFEEHVRPVADTYIVTFKGYYPSTTRLRFLTAAFHHINNGDDDTAAFQVLPRHNLCSSFPSNFDLVYLKGELKQNAIDAFQAHPAVRRVTPEHRLSRVRKQVNPTLSNAFNNQSNSFKVEIDGRRRLKWFLANDFLGSASRKLLRAIPRQITAVLHADHLWKAGLTGAGVRVAVFDTGLNEGHSHFRNVAERTDWTNEHTLDDLLGHGTFVAGVIASTRECLGFAPDAELHIFRVFTKSQISYTSWFLDAFNYAIIKRIHVLNLSIGGPDFMDQPFVDKVWELTANNIIMISAIGNDGPLYGTVNNPADQMDVIGVGGINFEDQIARFSSRGMTTWELPSGYGRVKPDIVTYGSAVRGSTLKGGCRTLSGTSVASPVAAGAIALLLSGVNQLNGHRFNVASVKQSLLHSARRIPAASMFEQGAGKLDLIRAHQTLRAYEPHVSLHPPYLDFTDCPYMWPYCTQPLYHGSMPVIVNITVLNGIGVSGRFVAQPKWFPYAEHGGHLLDVSVEHSKLLWPWSGWMAVRFQVKNEGSSWNGVIQGHINLTIESLPSADLSSGEEGPPQLKRSLVTFPIKVKVIPTPPRSKRLLWDQFHNLRYPPGYFPRDNLVMRKDPLDWNGDHIHTNFRDLYERLRASGYYVEVLGSPYTCFDARSYAALMIVDPEEEFFDEEIVKLKVDVQKFGLSVLLFADWYNESVMRKVKFFDENTRQWWTPNTGGSNVPALNQLLQRWDIQLSNQVLRGSFKLENHDMHYASGTSIAQFPADGLLLQQTLIDEGEEIVNNRTVHVTANILGLYSVKEEKEQDISSEHQPMDNDRASVQNKSSKDFAENEQIVNEVKSQPGRIAIYGDSNCLDSAHLKKDCFWLVEALLQFATTGQIPTLFLKQGLKITETEFLQMKTKAKSAPRRLPDSRLHVFSKVLLSPPNLSDHFAFVNQHESQPFESKTRPLPTCTTIRWQSGRLVNETLPNNLHRAYKTQLNVRLEHYLQSAAAAADAQLAVYSPSDGSQHAKRLDHFRSSTSFGPFSSSWWQASLMQTSALTYFLLVLCSVLFILLGCRHYGLWCKLRSFRRRLRLIHPGRTRFLLRRRRKYKKINANSFPLA